MTVRSRPESTTLRRMSNRETLTSAETRRLAALQRDVSKGNLAMLERNSFLAELFDDGVSQPNMVAVINDAATAVGDAPITSGAVHRAIKRAKAKVSA